MLLISILNKKIKQCYKHTYTDKSNYFKNHQLSRNSLYYNKNILLLVITIPNT